MSIKQTLYLGFDVEVYNLSEVEQAERKALEIDGAIYCWKTTENSNWLEKGLSISDVLGLVVLPKNLPEQIEMPDDDDLDD